MENQPPPQKKSSFKQLIRKGIHDISLFQFEEAINCIFLSLCNLWYCNPKIPFVKNLFISVIPANVIMSCVKVKVIWFLCSTLVKQLVMKPFKTKNPIITMLCHFEIFFFMKILTSILYFLTLIQEKANEVGISNLNIAFSWIKIENF